MTGTGNRDLSGRGLAPPASIHSIEGSLGPGRRTQAPALAGVLTGDGPGPGRRAAGPIRRRALSPEKPMATPGPVRPDAWSSSCGQGQMKNVSTIIYTECNYRKDVSALAACCTPPGFLIFLERVLNMVHLAISQATATLALRFATFILETCRTYTI